MTRHARTLLLLGLLALASGARAAPAVDAAAPAFTLADTDGKPRALADFKGKTVVLEWLNYDCPFVRKHYGSGNMQRLQKEWTAKGVVWLSVVSSAPGKQGNFPPAKLASLGKEKGSSPTAILVDESGAVGRLYGAKTTPHIFVIDPAGTLRYDGAIDSIRSADPDDIPKAENYVAAALQSVLAGQPVKTPTSQPYGCSVKY